MRRWALLLTFSVSAAALEGQGATADAVEGNPAQAGDKVPSVIIELPKTAANTPADADAAASGMIDFVDPTATNLFGATVPSATTRKSLAPGAPAAKVASHRDYTFDASADIKEIFTTNANAFATNANNTTAGAGTIFATGSTGPTSKQSDFDTKLSASFTASVDRPRFTANISNTLSEDLYARSHSLDQTTDYLALLTTTQLVPNILSVDARAYSTPVNQTNLGLYDPTSRAQSGSGQTGYSDSVGYSVAPTLHNRFGDFGTSTLRVSEGASFFMNHQNPSVTGSQLGQTPQSSRTTEASEDFRSGTDFNRLQWDLNGDYSKSTGGVDLTNSNAGEETDYAINHQFVIIAKIGRDWISASQALVSGVSRTYAMAGFRYHPNPNVVAHLEIGSRFGRPSITGDANYSITPRTTLTANLTNTVTTPTQRLLNNLNTLTPQTLNTSVVPLDQLQFTNTVDQVQSGSVSLSHQMQRSQTALTFFATRQRTLTASAAAQDPNQNSAGATLSFNYSLSQTLAATASGTYSLQRQGVGVKDKIMQLNAELDYKLGRKTTVSFGTSYFARIEDQPGIVNPFNAGDLGGSLRDVEVTVSLHRSF